MRFHTFNIGKPHVDTWWKRNLQLGVITAGFDGEPGDRGDVLLHQMDEGDWVVAYSNGHGYVGAGEVGPATTYRIVPPSELPDGWESTHRHLRQVDWIYAVESLAQAVRPDEAGRQAPRQTKELLQEAVGSRIVKLLAARNQRSAPNETILQFNRTFAARVDRASRDTPEARQRRLQSAKRYPERAAVLSYEFVRNPDVVAEVLYRSGGTCGWCLMPAPFARRTDGSPYLEVHHKVPLAAGGEDTVANAIALCPNCHRKRHHGPSEA